MKKKPFKYSIFAAFFLLLLILAAVIFVSSGSGENILKNILISRISEAINQQVAISNLETNLLSRLKVEDICILDSSSDLDNCVLNVNSIEVHYNLFSMLLKTPSIKSVLVDTVRINLHRNELGRYNLEMLNLTDTLPAPDTTSEPSFELTLGTFGVNSIVIAYNDEISGLGIQIDGCETRINHTDTAGYRFMTKADRIAGLHGDLPILFQKFEISGNLSSDFLQIDSLNAFLDGLSIGGKGRFEIAQDTTVAATFLMSGKPGAIVDSLISAFDLPGIELPESLELAAEVDGHWKSPRATVRLSLPEIKSQYGIISDLQLTAGYLDSRVILDSMSADVFGGVIKAAATAELGDEKNISAEISLADIDMAMMWRALYEENSPYQGYIGGKIKLKIQGDDVSGWEIASNIEASKAKYLGKDLPNFFVAANLANGIGRLRIHQPDFEIILNSAMGDSDLKGNFSADITNLKPLADLFNIHDVAGGLNASGTLAGTFNAPEVKADIKAESVRYRNFPIDNFDAEISYKDNQMNVIRMEISGYLDSVEQANPPLGLDSLTGGINYRGWAAGKFENLEAGLTIELLKPGYGKWGIDHGNISLSSTAGIITLDSAYFSKDAVIMKVNGSYDIDKSDGGVDFVFYRLDDNMADANSVSDTLMIGTIESAFHLEENQVLRLMSRGRDLDIAGFGSAATDTPAVGGAADFDFSFEGNLENPSAELEIKIIRPMLGNIDMDSTIFRITLADRKIDMSRFKSYKGEYILSGNVAVSLVRDNRGGLTLDETSAVRGKIQYDNWDISLANPFLTDRAKLSGLSTLDLGFDGTLGRPALSGIINLDNCRAVMFPQSDSITGLNVKLIINDSLVTINRFDGLINNVPFEIRGNIAPLNRHEFRADLQIDILNRAGITIRGQYDKDNVDFEADVTDLELSLLEPFMPSVKQLSGILNSSIRATGNANDPIVTGNLAVDNLTLQPVNLPSPVTNGKINISFDKKTLNLDSLSLKINGGTFLAGGSINHESGHIRNINLTGSIDDIKLFQPGQYELDIRSADFHYTGDNENLLLDGDVQMGESKFLKNITAQSILSWIRSVEKAETGLPEYLDRTRLDIRIRESDKLWVDNNLAHIRLHSELGIIGSLARPNVTGRLSIEEGYVLYLDRKFKVKRGVVFFNDPFKLNPEIDMLAEAKVTNHQALEKTTYTIKIEIKGTGDDVTTGISSDPPLDQADILALLTLGATRSQLTGRDPESGDFSTKDILLERAAMLSSSKISGYVSQRMGSFLGLEEVSVEGNLFKFDRTWGPQLLASKKLSDRIQLTYKTTVGHLNDQSVKLNYRLTRRFSVEGQTDRQGRSGLDLIYDLRFK